ncbi:MAG: hypothetical protein AB9903_29360 [Vulcanimicrobiota bacterium]
MEVLSLKDRKNPADFEKNFRWLKTYVTFNLMDVLVNPKMCMKFDVTLVLLHIQWTFLIMTYLLEKIMFMSFHLLPPFFYRKDIRGKTIKSGKCKEVHVFSGHHQTFNKILLR